MILKAVVPAKRSKRVVQQIDTPLTPAIARALNGADMLIVQKVFVNGKNILSLSLKLPTALRMIIGQTISSGTIVLELYNPTARTVVGEIEIT